MKTKIGLAVAVILGVGTGMIHAERLAEWVADPSHPLVTGGGIGNRALSIGYLSGRNDSANTAVWAFAGDMPVVREGISATQPALYGFLEQTHSLGADNFLVAALDAEGRIKIHSRDAASGETVAMRGALGFIAMEMKGPEPRSEVLRLLADVVNNAKGSSIFYRAIVKSGDKWFLSDASYPGTTGEKEFIFSTTQWAEWDPLSSPGAELPSLFPVTASALGKPDFVGLFFDGTHNGSGMGIMVVRLTLDTTP